MTKILFVCHGNICRSPAAELLLRRLLLRAGLGGEFETASAATSSEEIGNPVYPPMRRVLAERGIDCAGKTARQLRRRDYQDYDLLIGMEERHLKQMQRICGGDPEGKIHLLLENSPHPRDIDDPWYTDDFDTACRDIQEGCRLLLNSLIEKYNWK